MTYFKIIENKKLLFTMIKSPDVTCPVDRAKNMSTVSPQRDIDSIPEGH